ncbi:MAG: hypothetical protein CFH06_01605 [Alphaproteobacteria bacterium MarineAlpha3_Bin5]|nr:hypothetical protein [Magnetovibrio sp.]PPR76851.1 MAG: hypothetical protein CFH06_01605 [Alphaproteobacteria bacterium MarineAlpha3_Bin5]|tara:strand:+ start:121 stop:438 length:318 start_codon:yes stop_codon:yes gene_type:complete
MAKYFFLGTYSNEGAAGLLSGATDRKAAIEALTQSVGGKLISVDITRGKYDACVVVEADSFDVAGAVALKVRASGAMDELIVLEAVDINKIAETATSVNYTPPQG